jgi:MoaA/NifB/PqqE/SkfB family radical SAM enzyme
MLTERVVEDRGTHLREVASASSIGINLSLDGVGDEHDDIRGVEGNWQLSLQALETAQRTARSSTRTWCSPCTP